MSQKISASQQDVLEAVEALLRSRQRWDEAPALCFIYRQSARTYIRQVPLPSLVWRGFPPDALKKIADLPPGSPHRELLARAAPAGWHGVMFRNESWCAPGGLSQAIGLWSAGRSLRELPARIEARIGAAVDRAGIRYAVMLERESGVVRSWTGGAGFGPGGLPLLLSGDVYNSLDSIARALAGR